ncbi:MAG: helix-turn-helix transcriptional regulator [Eubacteriales bacterium]|nr:helix-turn-helix transcriptional regulator [Eubacteriales bacterium]
MRQLPGTADQREVGQRIRVAREARGLSQDKLGAMLDVDGNTVYRYENARGGSMTLDTFFRIVDALGCTPSQLSPSRFDTHDHNTQRLIEAFSQLTNDQQKYFLFSVEAMAQSNRLHAS